MHPIGEKREVLILGVEAHICVTQTALDLRREGHNVYVLADGITSCNPGEIPITLARLRGEGVVVTTSESWLYEYLGNAEEPVFCRFKAISQLVKESNNDTRLSVEAFCKM